MRYGTPVYRWDDDQDDRIGILSSTASMFWQVSRSGLSKAEIDSEEPPPPGVPGGLLLVGRQRKPNGGGYRTFWRFEGISGDGKGVTFKDRSTSLDYQFDPGFAQLSILLHKRFPKLQQQYGGTLLDGSVIWPATMPKDASLQARGAAFSDTEGKPNPMFGHTTYLEMEGTYTFRYASLTKPTQAGTGQIFGTAGLPGEASAFPGRNWLKAPTVYRRRGLIFEVIESYWLSYDGGWPEPIYGRSNNGQTATDGLRTGGLQPS